MSYKDKHILVLGLGESGLAIAKWLAHEGAVLRVADSRESPPGCHDLALAVPSADLVCAPFTQALLENIDLVVLSPGVPINEPVVLKAIEKNIPVAGEIEIFAQALETLQAKKKSRVIAITGTNGKTTTTSLVGALCNATGLKTAIAGNISPAALQELFSRVQANDLPDIWVLELSSFQLETTRSLKLAAGTVLNITDDHLDRHGSIPEYAKIKSRIFANCAVQVLNRDDALTMAMREETCQQWSFGLSVPCAPHQYGIIEHEGEQWLAAYTTKLERLIPCRQLQLAGAHNVANTLAALALCESLMLDRTQLLDALKKFKSLPHRVEWVASRAENIDFYDDSKGTNVGATMAALQGLGRKVVLIAGGDGKGQDFTPLRQTLKAHARAVVLIGRDAHRFETEVAGCGVPLVHATDLNLAVTEANALAQTGDAVLLSPACASMDMFRNYAHRAQIFVDAVLHLPGVIQK